MLTTEGYRIPREYSGANERDNGLEPAQTQHMFTLAGL